MMKKKKKKLAAAAPAKEESNAGDSAPKVKPTVAKKDKGKRPEPKIFYRECGDAFLTYYNALQCKTFSFKSNLKAKARKMAEDSRV